MDKEGKWGYSYPVKKDKRRKMTINNSEKVLISEIYDRRLFDKNNRDDILDDLARMYSKSKRQIERYIEDGRKIKTKKLVEKVEEEQKSKFLLLRHFDELAETAKVIASDINLSMQGELDAWLRLDGCVLETSQYPEDSWLKDIRFPKDDPWKDIHYHLAPYLLLHFNQLFPGLAMKQWSEATSSSVTQDIIDKMLLLAHNMEFKVCPDCPVCRDLQS